MLNIILENSNKLFPGPTLPNIKFRCDKLSLKKTQKFFGPTVFSQLNALGVYKIFRILGWALIGEGR